MMATGTCSQLERMAGELRCPICLSLYKQAASLSCNHCFCISCILQSLKRISCCPICKVPATPREVRSSPQMDSLVAICKGMETSAGVSLFQTQPSQSKDAEEQYVHQEGNVLKLPKSRGRKKKPPIPKPAPNFENIKKINPLKNHQRGESELVLSDRTNKQACCEEGRAVTKKGAQPRTGDLDGSIHNLTPLKKRLQVTGHPSLIIHARNKDKAQQSTLNCVSSNSSASTSSLDMLDPATGDRLIPRVVTLQGEGRLRMDSSNKGIASQSKAGNGLASPSSGPHHENLHCRFSLARSPYLDSSREQPAQLAPFFWLRDQVLPSQDELPTQPTQTQTQQTAIPLRPSFSDLKGSDDEKSEDGLHQDEVVGLQDADSYDSDTFVWTQRPCSPELSSSPFEHADLPAQHKSINEQEIPGGGENTVHEFDDEGSRSPSKCVDEVPVAVEATQTPQLHQEPARTMKGTPLKCTSSKKRKRGRPSGKVCRSLKSNDPVIEKQKSLAGLGIPRTSRIKRTQKHKKALSENSSGEGHAATNRTRESDDVCLDENIERTAENLSVREGIQNEDDKPELQQQDISRGETMALDGPLKSVCVFCGSTGDSEVAGPIVEYKDAFPSQGLTRIKAVHVHKLCAEWAPDVYFEEDEPRNLACEVTRGQKIRCSSCGKRGAALGCCNKRCKKSFHYPCGRATSGCKWDEDDFVMFCPHHADCKFPRRKRCRINPRKDHVLVAVENNKGGISNKNPSLMESTTAQLQRWPIGPACKWVLCGSGLDSQTKGKLAAFALLTGASMVKRWSPSVTHVITGTDEWGAAKRTLKFLMAMLVGKWIVKVDWMLDCMTAGHILAEDQYEVKNVNGFVDGPKRSRTFVVTRGPKLLEGLSFYFCGEFTSMSKEDLKSLIIAGRGMVLHRKPLPLERSQSNGSRIRTKVPQTGQVIVLYNAEEDGKDKAKLLEEAQAVACLAGAAAVPHTWLLDSVAACMLQPTT